MLVWGLLAVWMVGQMPWMLALVVVLHGSHTTTASASNNRMVAVFAHQADDNDPEHNHNDHVVSVPESEKCLRRLNPSVLLPLTSTPVFAFQIKTFPKVDDTSPVLPLVPADLAPPLLALRTVVLMV